MRLSRVYTLDGDFDERIQAIRNSRNPESFAGPPHLTRCRVGREIHPTCPRAVLRHTIHDRMVELGIRD